MAETIFWWVYVLASACAFIFGYWMVEGLLKQWLARRGNENKKLPSSPEVNSKNPAGPAAAPILRGYDSPDLFWEDTLIRIRRGEAEINSIATKINRVIEKEKLPVEPMPYLYEPEAKQKAGRSGAKQVKIK